MLQVFYNNININFALTLIYINSGLEYDTCGVCGGDGTDCVGVGRVLPNIIPDNATEVSVLFVCLFVLFFKQLQNI